MVSLPPFPWLQAFEATARHASFTRAALELGVTQAAVSHRIRNLEDMLDVKLFVRDASAVVLTSAAHDFLASIRSVIEEVRLATERLSHHDRSDILTIACTGSFSTKCLLPILPLFREKYPDIKLKIRKLSSLNVHQRPDYDVAIQYGKGDLLGRAAERICREEVFPVCSPALMRGPQPITTPDDLSRHTIIRVMSPVIVWDEWPRWFEAAGYPNVRIVNELFCEVLFPSFQAAIAGLGVVMGRNILVSYDLRDGFLIEPFSTRLITDSGYYLMFSAAAERDKPDIIRAFRDWLIETANESIGRMRPKGVQASTVGAEPKLQLAAHLTQ
ncbi:MAG: LysR family transcriptional regulator [Hyphomicrobiales bacterium]|nr:LysR family transcriptional regulator [Hyphomicrobiales bacterium]